VNRLQWRWIGLLAPTLFTLTGTAVLPIRNDDAKPAQEWKVPSRATKKKNPIAAEEKSIARGKAIYRKECRTCHGESGRGDGPKATDLQKRPSNLADPKIRDQTDGTLFYKITEGRTPMPAFDKTLKDDQRWDLVNYLRTLAPEQKNAPKSIPK
jgi:mono/diheme cytochrome c family protein